MWWRITANEFETGSRNERKAVFRKLADAGPPPGLLLYEGNLAVGWVAVGPRSTLPRIERSRVAKPISSEIDDPWFINCFYLRRGHRSKGHMSRLIEAATGFAREAGAEAVEACPIEPDRPLQWGEGFVGIASAFKQTGFEEIARRSPKRPLMRLTF